MFRIWIWTLSCGCLSGLRAKLFGPLQNFLSAHGKTLAYIGWGRWWNISLKCIIPCLEILRMTNGVFLLAGMGSCSYPLFQRWRAGPLWSHPELQLQIVKPWLQGHNDWMEAFSSCWWDRLSTRGSFIALESVFGVKSFDQLQCADSAWQRFFESHNLPMLSKWRVALCFYSLHGMSLYLSNISTRYLGRGSSIVIVFGGFFGMGY